MATRKLLGPKTRNEKKCPLCGVLNINSRVCTSCGNSLDFSKHEINNNPQYKDPVTARVYSPIFPGLGHLYNIQIKKIAVMLIISVITVFIIITSI